MTTIKIPNIAYVHLDILDDRSIVYKLPWTDTFETAVEIVNDVLETSRKGWKFVKYVD